MNEWTTNLLINRFMGFIAELLHTKVLIAISIFIVDPLGLFAFYGEGVLKNNCLTQMCNSWPFGWLLEEAKMPFLLVFKTS